MKAEDFATPTVRKMLGSGGAYDYTVIAQNEKTVLGIKSVGVRGSSYVGLAGGLWVSARIRTSGLWSVEGEDMHAFQPTGEDCASMFPGIEFGKRRFNYASAVMGLVLQGDNKTAKGLLGVIECFQKLEHAERIADFLIERIGDQYMIFDRDMLISIIDGLYADEMSRLRKRLLKYEEDAKKLGTEAGKVFLLHELQKKVEAATAAHDPFMGSDDDVDDDTGED